MLSDFINFITPYLTLLGNWTYLLVFVCVILETLIGIGFIFPGTTIIVLISFFSAQTGLDPKIMFLSAFLGTLIGNITNYFLGAKYFKRISSKNSPIIKSNTFERVKRIINNNPIKSIILGRLTPGLKETIPFVSGIIGINFYKFIIYSSFGTIMWGIAFIGIPYIFSYSLDLAQLWLNRFSYFILVLFFAGVFISFFKYFLTEYGRKILNFIKLGFIIFGELIYRQKTIKYLIIKNPKIVFFIKNRFKKGEFNGLLLTILSLLMIYTISSFLGLIKNLLTSDLIIGLDYRLYSFFYAFRNDFLVNIFLWITYLGRFYIIFGFFILVSFYLYIENKKHEILSLLISVLGSSTLVYLFKIFFHHSRPEYGVYIEKSYSFPSGHSSIAVAFYGFLFWIIIRNTRKWKSKINYFFTALILIFLLGFSRLYLGVHYFSDVLGGYLIGIFWLLFAIGLTEFLNKKYNNLTKIYNFCLGKTVLKFLLILISLEFFILYNLFIGYKIINLPLDSLVELTITNINEIFKTDPLKYSQTFMGKTAENINFIFLAQSSKKISNVFEKSLWTTSDKLNIDSFKMIGNNLVFQKPYNNAPITPIFWNNKTQDFSFQKLPDDKNIRFRHHIRIWKTNFKYEDYFVYVGVGVFDAGLKWHITHKIDPNINKEVEYIFSDLKNTGFIEKYEKLDLVKPYNGKNVFGDIFYSDGKAYLIKLK